MAKVSAHGETLGTVEGLTGARRYMSDGVVLVNRGHGWKVHGRVQAGVEPMAALERAITKLHERRATHPAWWAYRHELHELAGIGKRWKLHAAICMMPDDPDGVWSETCDGFADNVVASVDEIAALCRAYKVAVREINELSLEKPQA